MARRELVGTDSSCLPPWHLQEQADRAQSRRHSSQGPPQAPPTTRRRSSDAPGVESAPRSQQQGAAQTPWASDGAMAVPQEESAAVEAAQAGGGPLRHFKASLPCTRPLTLQLPVSSR